MRISLSGVFGALIVGALVASCDLQPKITSVPDGVGDFISSRYPTLLADPETESEIYNSAVTDYGVYESSDLYGSSNVQDYVNYVSPDDYVLKESSQGDITEKESVDVSDNYEKPEVVVQHNDEEGVSVTEVQESPDILSVNDYVVSEKQDTPIKNDILNIPEKKITAKKVVVVQKGDTLYSIAKKTGKTVDELAAVNNLETPYVLRIGQELSLEKNAATQKTEKIEEKKTTQQLKTETQKVPEQKKIQEQTPQKTQVQTVVRAATQSASVKQQPKTKTITVGAGDTLYSLSRTYSLPVNDLAVMNNLRPPFDLHVGQTLVVPNISPKVVASVPEPVKPVVKTQKNESVQNTEQKTKTENKVVVKHDDEKKEVSKNKDTVKTAKPVEKVKQPENKKTASENKKTIIAKDEKKQGDKKTVKTEKVKQQKPAKKQTVEKKETKKTTNTKQPEPQKIAARSSSKFTWPVRGKILSHYGAKTGGLFNDGINVSASLGTTVVAAENGVVAYAGNEVKGMGNLIIIQHEDGWMTVYAHLNSVGVRRGARVTVGQKIGTVGQTGKVTQPQLHFEIRKGRKAYNPVNYLKK